MANDLPTPITNDQKFLAAAAGMYVVLPTAITIDQQYLKVIAENSGGTGDAYTKAETDALLGGKADLTDGKVPASELPSYVDDTVEGYYYNGAFYEDSSHTTAITGERGKIYVDLTANKSYRWTGSVYTRIDECPAFGETAGTIYEGNKGKANADAIGTLSSLTTTEKTSLVGAINELDSDKVDKVSGKGLSTEDYTTAEKTKLSGIAAGAEVNVQANWTQTDTDADDYIKNKPTLGTAASRGVDTTATDGSTNLITSGGVYTIVGNINAVLESVL